MACQLPLVGWDFYGKAHSSRTDLDYTLSGATEHDSIHDEYYIQRGS